jgi:S-adenosylhomocysteine hydrolase
MLVKLYKMEHMSCDLAVVANWVNRLQYFFVARVETTPLLLPAKFARNPVLSPRKLAHWFQKKSPAHSVTRSILITSHNLGSPGSPSLYHFNKQTAIITDHHWDTASAASMVRLARHIIQAGMATLGCHHSNVKSCICRSSDGFDCLCASCEMHLRSLGYRDSITKLKETLNLLNQVKWSPTFVFSKKKELAPLPTALHLATRYAKEITQAERQKGQLPPFEGIIILIVLHFLSDLIPFVEALKKLGCPLENMYLVAKAYPYARRDEVNHGLISRGVTTLSASKNNPVKQCAKHILELVAQRLKTDAGKKILVIEDGGYFAPLLHKPKFSHLLRLCLGIVEQTQKGANTDREVIGEKKIKVPILDVAESEFKNVYESPEIGRVAILNISRFTPNLKLSGGHAVLFGFGSVGQEVAFHLNSTFNMAVSVVDNKPLPLLRARHRKDIVAEAGKSFDALHFGQRAVLVVGTTGRKSITKSVFQQLPDGAVLVSTSSDQVEIALETLEDLARGRVHEIELGKHEYTLDTKAGKTKKLVLLAEGYPINFYGSESLPNDTIDPVMTLLLLCGVEVVLRWRRNEPFSAGILTKEVNEVANKRKLVKRFLSRSI